MKRTGVEWVGGMIALPPWVGGEQEPYRSEALVWLGADGAVLGHVLGRPGELSRHAAESLRETIATPLFGRAHAPTRVRVASRELAEALRAGHEGIEIVCAPTPELDSVADAMCEGMRLGDALPSYLSPRVDPDAVAAFFRAAAELFRARPWEQMPSDHDLLEVRIAQLGLRDAALSIIGQMGQSRGFILFSSVSDLEEYMDGVDAIEHGEEPEMPPHLALTFERGAELGGSLRKEILRWPWDVAAADAHPVLVAVDDELGEHPPTEKELTIAEAIALALTRLLGERSALTAAWSEGTALERTLVVSTHAGDLEVTLRVPPRGGPASKGPAASEPPPARPS